MLNTPIPRTRYNTTDYPNLDPDFDGALIPVGIGDIHNIPLVCIDTAAQLYEFLGHAIHAASEVRTPDGVVLAAGVDYTLNAGNNRVSLLATPYLAANTTYILVVEADYGISAANYLRLVLKSGYANGQLYTIDGSDAWTPDAAHDLMFRVYGRETLGGTEVKMVDNGYQPNTALMGLRNIAARTRIAQSFKTPASKSFYVTRVQLFCRKVGTPAGSVRVAILSAYTPAEVQVGIKSLEAEIPLGAGSPRFVSFPQRATDSGLIGDVEAAEKSGVMIADGADALEWLVGTELGKSTTLLDAAHLANLKAKRTQEVKIFCDQEDVVFGDIVGKLETTLLFKYAKLLDGTYGTIVYEAGEPAGTPHFRDQDYLGFEIRYDWRAIRYKVAVKYDEDPEGRAGYKVEEASSDFARFFYETEAELKVETYHRTKAGAAWLAGELSGMYEAPPAIAEVEVHGWGTELIPARDKIKLTRARAGYAGGSLSGVLFRIQRLTKHGNSTCGIAAQLDTQTY